MSDLEMMIAIVKAYKNYIDGNIDLTEQERSDLLMIARNLDNEALFKGIYV